MNRLSKKDMRAMRRRREAQYYSRQHNNQHLVWVAVAFGIIFAIAIGRLLYSVYAG